MVEILGPAYVPPIVHSFFLHNGTQNYSGVSEHLLAVQVIELLDGIFIGCTINHMIVDDTAHPSGISSINGWKYRWFVDVTQYQFVGHYH